MTIWVFGEKYTHSESNQWIDNVANSLNTTIQDLSINGTALEFVYQRFNYVRDHIKENDIIIITFPNFDRRWFFKGYPQYAEVDKSPTNNKNENRAIKLFRKHLDHKEIHKTYLIDFLFNLHALTEELELHTNILFNFQDIEEFILNIKQFFPLFNIVEGQLSNKEIENRIK